MKNDAPEHKKIGQIQPKLLKDIGLPTRIIDKKIGKNFLYGQLIKWRKEIPVH